MANRHIIEVTQANHRARAVYRNIALLGEAYKWGMQQYVSAMQSAMSRQLSADDGLSTVQDGVQSKLTALDRVLLEVPRREMNQISGDQVLPESTRQKLADFWSNYLELKRYVDSPRGTVATYQAKCNALCATHDRLSERLKVMLAIGDDDD
jgi:hypothetical protein